MNHEDYNQTWLKHLDAVIAGEIVPEARDDERLQVAQRLSQAFVPLTTLGTKDEEAYRRLHSRMHEQIADAQSARRVIKIGALRRPLRLVSAVLLLCIFGLGMIEMHGFLTTTPVGTGSTRSAAVLGQVQRPDPSQLARPHAGIRPLPLLPLSEPQGTQAVLYGVVTDPHDPNLLLQFVMDYRIQGTDLFLMEQPSSQPYTSAQARQVTIGTLDAQVFQDEQGNNALQWYQNQMVCQLIGTLPVEKMVSIASAFQQLKSWDPLL